MKTKLLFSSFVFAIIVLILSTSCKKDEDIQSKLSQLEGKGYFPLQVGNYWKFSDLPKTEIDAIEVINNKEYFRFITDNDTAYYRKTQENKIFYLGKDNNDILLYDLSAAVGELWTTAKNPQDSTYVKLSSSNDKVDINEFVFSGCFKFSSDSYDQRIIDNESSTWLAPNIGRIQISGGIGIKKLEEVKIDGVKIRF
jgi:hypothetical protein